MISHSNQVHAALLALFDLPENIIELDLRLRIDEAVTATIKFYPEMKVVDGEVPSVTKTFKLVPIE